MISKKNISFGKKTGAIKMFLLLSLVAHGLMLKAQTGNVDVNYQCGTTPTSRVYPSSIIPAPTTPVVVKVYVHNFSGRYPVDTIIERLQVAASFFLPHKICFMLSGYQFYQNGSVPQYMGIMDIANPDAVAALQSRVIPGHINIFIHGSLAQGKQDFDTWFRPDGYCYSSPGNAISIGYLKQTTLAHQLGHCLGLLDLAESTFGSENVGTSGGCSNCSTAGDLLCGTAASRHFPDSIINLSCRISGSTLRDDCGNLINGLGTPENLMSETKESCKSLLVQAQGDRARSFLLLSPNLVATIAGTNLTLSTNSSITTGLQAYAAKNVLTLSAPNFSIGGSARVDFSAAEVTITPGSSFAPAAGGEVHIFNNRVVCN